MMLKYVLFFYFFIIIPNFILSNTELPPNHIRHVIFYEYSRGTSAAKAAQNIKAVYGEDSISQITCQRWFARFRSGDTNLEDAPRSGKPSEFDDQALISLLKTDNRQTTRDLAEQLGVSAMTVDRHLEALGYMSKLGAWVPHDLKETDKWQRMSICQNLLTRYHRKSFLPRIITGDEKWVFHVNFRRKRQWVGPGERPSPDPRPDLHRKKLMLCVWWDMEGIIYWELLGEKVRLNAALYSQQLDHVAEAVRTKRPEKTKIILQHDNARPHTAKLTKSKLQELGWEVLPHPAYSPDLAPSDYYLFRNLQLELDDKHFDQNEDVKNFLQQYFDSKPRIFYERGIRRLPTKWAQVIDSNGEYIE
jgi:[histone H3]-lysine36 N-dimethyltransferase SETMAR